MKSTASFLLLLCFLPPISPQTTKRSYRSGLNVIERDTSGLINASLAKTFSNFAAIASSQKDSTLEGIVAMFETNIQTMEFILMNHQSKVLELAAFAGDKMKALQDLLQSDASKAIFDDFSALLNAVLTIGDFRNGTASAGESSDTNMDATARINLLRARYSNYMQVQLVAAKNETKLKLLLTKLDNFATKDEGLAKSQDAQKAFAEFRAAVVDLSTEMHQYAVDCGKIATKVLSLQYDITFKDEVCKPLPRCGTFLYYDPEEDPMGPKREGVLAGKLWNRADVYVGTGDVYGYITPGYLLTQSPGPGVFVELMGKEFFFDNSADMMYLVDHPRLKWVNHTWVKNGILPPGTVLVKNSDISFGIARTENNSVTYVGKVMARYGFYYSVNGTMKTEAKFQVLVC